MTIVFALLYVSLPETIDGVATKHLPFGEPKFTGKQVNQRPMLIGVWLAIVVPLAAFGIVVTRRV